MITDTQICTQSKLNEVEEWIQYIVLHIEKRIKHVKQVVKAPTKVFSDLLPKLTTMKETPLIRILGFWPSQLKVTGKVMMMVKELFSGTLEHYKLFRSKNFPITENEAFGIISDLKYQLNFLSNLGLGFSILTLSQVAIVDGAVKIHDLSHIRYIKPSECNKCLM
jgi:hypothetical protein